MREFTNSNMDLGFVSIIYLDKDVLAHIHVDRYDFWLQSAK